MEIKEMTVEELEARKTAIAAEVDAEGADLDALETEVRAIKAELEERKAAEAKKSEIRSAVAAGAGKVVKTFEEEKTKMPTIDEIRSSKEYIEAYANYIKTGRPDECRSIVTTYSPTQPAGGGPVPVPVFVDSMIRTAWENDPIMSRVKRTFLRGVAAMAFEYDATPAVPHVELGPAPTEEEIQIGTVSLIPQNIKKWITITDEAMTMGGEDFLRYIYDEITYQITRRAAALGIDDIVNAQQVDNNQGVGVPVVQAAPGVTTVPTAAAHLTDQASDVVVVMNRLTEIEFLNAQAQGNFSIDPFAGLPRLYTSALNAYSETSEGGTYAIVGDLRALQYNYPEGDGIVIKYDDLSLAEKDLVKIVGRQYVAHGITEPGRLVKVVKPA